MFQVISSWESFVHVKSKLIGQVYENLPELFVAFQKSLLAQN